MRVSPSLLRNIIGRKESRVGCRIILKEEEMHVAGVGERLCAYLLLLFGEVVASVAACREGEIGKRAVGHLFLINDVPFRTALALISSCYPRKTALVPRAQLYDADYEQSREEDEEYVSCYFQFIQ